MSGLALKRNAEEAVDRRRKLLGGEMRDGILATLPVRVDTDSAWEAFEAKWQTCETGEARPFPGNEEIFERYIIGMSKRGQVDDDWLPVVYSTLDFGESLVGGQFGSEMTCMYRPRGPGFSKAATVVTDYADLPTVSFSLDNEWTRRFLSVQDYFEAHDNGRFAQHPSLTMDALNFVVEMRGSTRAYLDLYEHPEELRALMEIGLDYNIRFQEAQMERIPRHAEGCFVWLADWAPYPRAVSFSVDAYVICSVKHYVEFGFEYQSRLAEHFGCAVMHFHCNRPDLAAEVAKLPNLRMFQYGHDSRDPLPDVDRVPDMRRAVGDVPLMVWVESTEFQERLARQRLLPNVWYCVAGDELEPDEANRLAEKVRAYRA